MPNKTDRILSYLPFTFLAATRQSALRALAASVGSELQLGEASLARIMRSHWVDSADEGALLIADLEKIGSMYGLSPLRDDTGAQLETVEQFRRRLKRYVRTLLEGRSTVRGLINVAAQILDVTVAEGDDLDVWWKRRQPETVTVEPRGEDAAAFIFGQSAVDVRGVDAQPAIVQGTADLSQGANLENGSVLRIQMDADPPATIDLATGVPDIRSVSLSTIREAINATFPGTATDDGRFLALRSLKTGGQGRIEFEEVEGDASFAIFGVPAHIYTGSDARHAEVLSTVDLGGGVDLTQQRFLRIVVDGDARAEIDCAAATPAVTTLKHVSDAINEALGVDIASPKDGHLLLRSPNPGSGSSIFIQEPAAQSATGKLLGQTPSFSIGADPRPAIAAGVRDLSAGVDLSQRAVIRVAIDGGAQISINCAGARPAETTVNEIVAKLNAALGPGAASAPRGRVTLSSSSPGKTGQIVFERAEQGDALEDIFGFGPRVFEGNPALAASFTGTADLSDPETVNFFASYLVALQIDEGPLVEVDFRQKKGLTPQQIAKTIDETLKDDIAFSEPKIVGLTSTSTGSQSRIAILPLEREVRRRFVTRAAILDEAARLVLGFPERTARGRLATSARVDSQIDLQFGVDLRTDRWLSVSIDGEHFNAVDCAGPRPRTTTVEEIYAALSAPTPNGLGPSHVKLNGKRLSVLSNLSGTGSRIAFDPVRIQDAADILLKVPLGERRGHEAGRVIFTSTVDLSKGIDLVADARIKIGVDAVSPVEVILNSGIATARKTLNEIVTAINGTVAATVASHDGRFLILASRERGAASKLVFLKSSGTDATKGLFGFEPPRSYQGDEATQAVITGTFDIPATSDLRIARFLRVSVDGRPAFVIDCASAALAAPGADLKAVTPDQIKAAINNGFLSETESLPGSASSGLANIKANRLELSSSTVGAASRISIEPFIAGDARKKIFGEVPDFTQGDNALPAEIVGEVALSKPLDLTLYRKLLLNVDSGRPVEIDIAGEEPTETTLSDIVNAINDALPGVASATAENFLRLRTVSAGPGSTLEVLPRRYIELVEHPIFDQSFDAGVVPHGVPVVVHNSGVEASVARVEILSINGTVDPAVVNHFSGRKVGLNGALRPGEKVIIEQDGDAHLTVAIEKPDGNRTSAGLLIEAADPQPSGAGLELPRGDSQWTFVECLGPRFNEARFNQGRYPGGGVCETVGMFDLSHLDGESLTDQSIFAPDPLPEASASLSFRWKAFQGGAFELVLPAELRPVFGGRFNEARFGLGTVDQDGVRIPRIAGYAGVVFDPKDDPDYVVKRFEKGKVNPMDFVVEASDVLTNTPLGFVANRVPFRTPRFLTRGDDKEEAKIYLLESDSGRLIELKAEGKGAWGNQISVAVRPDGPGRYQLEIGFAGDRFESARSLVLGPPETAEVKEASAALLPKQGPGVLRAKAAGISARVTRGRAGDSN